MIENNYPIELEPLDISSYRQGNTGVDYITTFDSGLPGPHIMVNAITHGNELCGVVALDFLFRNEVRPLLGKLTLSFANVDAYHSFDKKDPHASRYLDEDFNRIWDLEKLDGNHNSREQNRAREMRPIVDQVDYLLDIHSMSNDTPAMLLPGALEKGKLLAQNVGIPEYIVMDHGHSSGRRLRDYDAFTDCNSPRNSLLVECGQHWSRMSGQVAIETTLRFLLFFNVIDTEFTRKYLEGTSYPKQKCIEVTDAVTIKASDFRFVKGYKGMEVITAAGTVIALDGATEIVTPYNDCVLIMPSKHLGPGLTAVRLGRKC